MDMEAADGGIAESGSSGLSTLMMDTPGDLVLDLPCMQQKSDDDDCTYICRFDELSYYHR